MHRVIKETVCEAEFFLKRLGNISIETIYIGGGTPSLLGKESLSFLLRRLRELSSEPREWTIEANPESLRQEFLIICKEYGVSRLSLGIQTLQDKLMLSLGRPGNVRDNQVALDTVSQSWAGKVNVDLLVGLSGLSPTSGLVGPGPTIGKVGRSPTIGKVGQTLKDLKDDIRQVLEHRPGHLSLYALTPPAGTNMESGFIRPPGSGGSGKIDIDSQDELWLAGFDFLESCGYLNYEISNFSVPGHECLHNLRYWEMEPYLGVGPGAVSTLPGRCLHPRRGRLRPRRCLHPRRGRLRPRRCLHPRRGGGGGDVLRLYNTERIENFLAGEKNLWGIRIERIENKDFLFENLMMGLRLRRGLAGDRFLSRFGRSLPEIIPEVWANWERKGLTYVANSMDDARRKTTDIEASRNAYALNNRGRFILNTLLIEVQEYLDKLPAGSIPVNWIPCPSSAG